MLYFKKYKVKIDNQYFWEWVKFLREIGEDIDIDPLSLRIFIY